MGSFQYISEYTPDKRSFQKDFTHEAPLSISWVRPFSPAIAIISCIFPARIVPTEGTATRFLSGADYIFLMVCRSSCGSVFCPFPLKPAKDQLAKSYGLGGNLNKLVIIDIRDALF